MSDKINLEHNEQPVCPKCGKAVHDDGMHHDFTHADEIQEFYCEKCECDFRVQFKVEVSYTTVVGLNKKW